MQGDQPGRGPPVPLSEEALWQRSRSTEATADEAARFLDLAAFADGRLDPDDRERVAEWLAADPDTAADVAAAGALSDRPEPAAVISEASIARARALVEPGQSAPARVIPFGPRQRRRVAGAQVLARWGSLAAAVAIASWLGFMMGADASGWFAPAGHAGDDSVFNELFDPSTSLIRDLTEGSQT